MISAVSGGVAPPVRQTRSNETSSGFRMPEPAAASGSEATHAVQGAALSSLLALQEFSENPPERRALKHGQALLAKLVRLQQAILAGYSTDSDLEELAQLADEQLEIPDSRLRAIVGAVVMRAKIELAKHRH